MSRLIELLVMAGTNNKLLHLKCDFLCPSEGDNLMQCYSFQVAQCVAVDSTHASIMLTATGAPCTPMETSDVPRQTCGLKTKK
jgi:hypothetical protein